jgi:hypothetical protein
MTAFEDIQTKFQKKEEAQNMTRNYRRKSRLLQIIN